MSGSSQTVNCPNCGECCNEYTDYKPFIYVIHSCISCGLMINPKIEYMNINDLNSFRIDNEMEPLDKLPEQKQDLW